MPSDAQVHWLPVTIGHDGPGEVSKYFTVHGKHAKLCYSSLPRHRVVEVVSTAQMFVQMKVATKGVSFVDGSFEVKTVHQKIRKRARE